jgi:hypothetical protein
MLHSAARGEDPLSEVSPLGVRAAVMKDTRREGQFIMRYEVADCGDGMNVIN